jgi:hypothetical protein
MAILDFSKAFDTLPHKKNLHKLQLYEVNGNINNRLKDFLTNRTIKVIKSRRRGIRSSHS